MRILVATAAFCSLLASCSESYDAVGQTALQVTDAQGPAHAVEIAERTLSAHGYKPMRNYIDGTRVGKGPAFYQRNNVYASLEQVTSNCFTVVSYVKGGSRDFEEATGLLIQLRAQGAKSEHFKIPFGEACDEP